MTRYLTVALVTIAAQGCIDIREFEGTWTGGIVSEDAVRQGFTPDTSVEALELENVDLEGLGARLTTSDGKFKDQSLKRVNKFSNDTIASLTFDGAPLRSYLMFAPLSGEGAQGGVPSGALAMMLISLFADDHVELRVLRGDHLFGVFNLARQEE
jgi:hypothetical protein